MTKLRDGAPMLYSTGLKSLDKILGGGYAPGEVVCVAASTSHGKTMVALQLAWAASKAGLNVLVVSEEMTPNALAERAIETASEHEQSEWRKKLDPVFDEVIKWEDSHPGKIFVPEVPCHSALRMLDTVAQAVVHFHVKVVVIDYIQLLSAPGGSRYEQVTNVSIATKQISTEHGVSVIALAQFNKQAEQEVMPKMHQIADSSQIPKDADIVLICKWPWKSDNKFQPVNEYWIACQKNRNRGIRHGGAIKLRFEPMRQRLVEEQDAIVETAEEYFEQEAESF